MPMLTAIKDGPEAGAPSLLWTHEGKQSKSRLSKTYYGKEKKKNKEKVKSWRNFQVLGRVS